VMKETHVHFHLPTDALCENSRSHLLWIVYHP
jgi:hypothetical protein